MKHTTKSYKENYREKLELLRKFVKETSGTSQNCVDLLETSIQEAINLYPGIEDDLIRTISKDFSRYADQWIIYQKALSQMGISEETKELRKVIVNSPIFFDKIWKEDSTEFFRTRKYLRDNVRNETLLVRINQTLNCIIVSLRRNLIDKYGK